MKAAEFYVIYSHSTRFLHGEKAEIGKINASLCSKSCRILFSVETLIAFFYRFATFQLNAPFSDASLLLHSDFTSEKKTPLQNVAPGQRCLVLLCLHH